MGNLKVLYSNLQFLDKTLITDNVFKVKIDEGKAFSAGEDFEDVEAGGTVEVFFENPSDSGKVVCIVLIEAVSFGQGRGVIYEGNTITSNGTAIPIRNLNLGSDNSSVVTVEYGGTYSKGNIVLRKPIPGGSRIRMVGGAAEIGQTVKIPPGKNILVELMNKSASSSDMGLEFVWWEE